MARVYPFRGFRYNKATVVDINLVVTQPYDKITPEMQDAYYERSPFNAVRITLGIEKRKDPQTDYATAGLTYRDWLDRQVLIQDPLPSFYACYQEYKIHGQDKVQKGFIALLDLKDSAAGIIPHERTLAEPKQDRLQLMRSIESNEDSIYMLYEDDRLRINRIMDATIAGRAPEIEATDEQGSIHRLWAITDPSAVRQIREAMDSQDLFIADGHHRFETSVNFMHECERRYWKPAATESFDKRMVTCFNSSDGVTILPTHRLIRDLAAFDARSFLQNLQEHFAVECIRSESELQEKMKEGAGDNVFGFYPGSMRQLYLLRLKPEAREDPLLLRHADACRRLDVNILHTLLLEHYLGIDESKLVAQAHVDYVREGESCIRLVDEGKYQAAFLLNPTPASQMQRVASMGERMPQKSTDFYPKLLTGLIFMKMHIAKP
jgi:uncharacterized protein (DUF1015 family)